jgi:hypothetical protein
MGDKLKQWFKYIINYNPVAGGSFEYDPYDSVIQESARLSKEWFKPIIEIVQSEKGLSYLPEGISFDDLSKTVSYLPDSEDYVNTSIDTNPTRDTGYGRIPVYSIFKRGKLYSGDDFDGNPLVYALKNEYGWRFKLKTDRNAIINQAEKIIQKFIGSSTYDVTILVPSGNFLNQFIGQLVQKHVPNSKLIPDVIMKMTTLEVYNDTTTTVGNKFRKTYNTPERFSNAVKKLKDYIKVMNQRKNGYFTFHLIPDDKMRNTISHSMKLSNHFGKYSADINDKDVLIIDDLTKEVYNIITTTFTPKSVTILTLFSAL